MQVTVSVEIASHRIVARAEPRVWRWGGGFKALEGGGAQYSKTLNLKKGGNPQAPVRAQPLNICYLNFTRTTLLHLWAHPYLRVTDSDPNYRPNTTDLYTDADRFITLFIYSFIYSFICSFVNPFSPSLQLLSPLRFADNKKRISR